MRNKSFARVRNFFRTTLIGGFVAIAPLTLIVIFFRWLISVIVRYLRPVVEGILQGAQTSIYVEVALYLITLAAILLVFFMIGLVIQTRISRFLNRFEERYLQKIPGYKLARDTVQQFFGRNRSFFKEVVLVDIFGTGVLMTGFITDDQEEVLTVFVPTGPNPTSGNIYHLPKDRVTRTSAQVDNGMKTIISCGAGSNEIFEARKKEEEA